MTRPCRVNSFSASFATASSTTPRNAGSASSTVTSAPRRRQTLPISSPMTPAPTTPSFFGTPGIASAPSLSSTRTLSMVAPGRGRGSRSRRDDHVPRGQFGGLGAGHVHAPGIAFLAGEGSLAVEERDLVLFEQVQDAVVVLRDDAVLARQHLRDVDRQVPSLRCRGRRTRARRARNSPMTAAAPWTGCSRHWCTYRRARACRRPASSRRCTRRGIPAAPRGSPRCSRRDRRRSRLRRIFQPLSSVGPAAGPSQNYHISSSRRAGSSSASLIATSDSTASRPSMIR